MVKKKKGSLPYVASGRPEYQSEYLSWTFRYHNDDDEAPIDKKDNTNRVCEVTIYSPGSSGYVTGGYTLGDCYAATFIDDIREREYTG